MKKKVVFIFFFTSMMLFCGEYTYLSGVKNERIMKGVKILIDLKGKEVVNFIKTDLNMLDYQSKLVKIYKKDTMKYGFMDMNGEMKTPIKYNSIYDFTEGMAAVNKDGKWGFIDENGVEVIDPKYDEINPFISGYARVLENDRYYFINKKGEECLKEISKKYSDYWIRDFYEGIANIEGKNGNCGYIDLKGKEIAPPIYKTNKYEVTDWDGGKSNDFENGYVVIRKNKKFGFLYKNGRVIEPKDYEHVQNFRYGRARVFKNNKYGYIDENGKQIIEMKYESANSFNEGLALVMLDEKQGLINLNGDVVVKFGKYDKIINLDEGMWAVVKKDKYAVLNGEGKEITPFKYHYDELSYKLRKFKNGYCSVILDPDNNNDTDNDYQGMIDKKGIEILKPEYTYIYDFENGEEYATIKDEKTLHFGAFNKKGEIKWLGTYRKEDE